MIIDTHAHLDHIPDVEEALKRAATDGVCDIVAVSTDLKAIRRNLELQSLHARPRIHVAFGIHPGDIKSDEVEETFAFMRERMAQAVAIGETGLDYWYKWARKNLDEQKRQRDCFDRHLALALEFDRPIVIHSRGAEGDCLRMTKDAGVKRALFHWYSGPLDILEKILNEGYYVSCSPSVGYSTPSREAMRRAPVERTLIETDSPVYYNHTDGGFQAEPNDVWRTLSSYAALKNIDEHEALGRLNINAKTFFQL